MKFTCPCEQIVADALNEAGIKYEHENEKHLDFYLPESCIYIEVKQFHSDRINEQMKRAENIIVIQGRVAAETFANLIKVKP